MKKMTVTTIAISFCMPKSNGPGKKDRSRWNLRNWQDAVKWN
jgi:hypothetical protein